MKTFSISFLILGCAVASISSQKAFLCYWTSWGASLSNSDPSLCSHVSYAFVDVDSNGVLGYASGMNTFKGLRNSHPNTKLLFSIGGANYNSNSAFRYIAESDTKRATFASNVLNYIQSNNLHGVDVDWEYPDNQAANFVALLHDLYNLLNPRGYLVTIAVGADNSLAPNRYDVANIARYVHYINLMTYDYHGTWESSTNCNAPLYGTGTIYTVDQTTQYWIARIGSSRNKLLLGIPLYGPYWSLTSGRNDIGAPGNPVGTMVYSQICQNIRNGWTRRFDNTQKTPYAFGNNQWVGYDDAESIQHKINYVNSNNIGGMFVWAMEMDDSSGSCNAGRFPLMTLMKNAMIGGTTSPPQNTQATNPPNPQTTTTASSGGGGGGTYVCPGAGIFKNPSSCSSFYNCGHAGSTPAPTPCGSGLLFNSNTNNCDWPANVIC